jgi:hypothetical protein
MRLRLHALFAVIALLMVFASYPALGSLRVTGYVGPTLFGKVYDDQQNTFNGANFGLDLAVRRPLVYRWSYTVGLGLHYGFASMKRDGLNYKGFFDAIGATASLIHPLSTRWDILLQGELVFRGLIAVKAMGTTVENNQTVEQSIVRTDDGFFGYAGRIMFLNNLRWQHRDFYFGMGSEYLFHQIQNQEVDTATTNTSTTQRMLVSNTSKLHYATIFIAIGVELFKAPSYPRANYYPYDKGKSDGRDDLGNGQEKVRRSYPPYGIP